MANAGFDTRHPTPIKNRVQEIIGQIVLYTLDKLSYNRPNTTETTMTARRLELRARKCAECGIEFEIEAHRRAITCSAACKTSRDKRSYANWYKNNQDKVLAAQARYVENNPERIRARTAAYRNKNLEKCRAATRRKQAEYRASHIALRELNLV